MEVVLRYPDPYPAQVVADILSHARDEYPKECCGIVVEEAGQFRYIPCDNIHAEPEKAFEIDPKITIEWMQRGALRACVHSHPDGPNHPSYRDQEQQVATGLPWGVVPVIGVTLPQSEEAKEAGEPAKTATIPGDIIWWGDQLPRVSLYNRRFIWGVFHCWTLMRDFYLAETGIQLMFLPCHDDFIPRGDNMFLDNVENAGLRNLGKVDMSELRRGDILLGHLRGEFPNHAGVYLGGDDFLHHPPDALSGTATLLRWWPHIDTVLRHDRFDEAASLWAAR